MARLEIEVPGEVDVPLPRNLGTVKVPVSTMPAGILGQLAIHGIRQKLADAFADKAKDGSGDGWAVARANKLVEAWRQGRWAMRGQGPRDTSPTMRAYRAAAAAYVAARPKPGVKPASRIAALVAAMADPYHPHHLRVMQDPVIRGLVTAYLAVAQAGDDLDVEADEADVEEEEEEEDEEDL